MLTLRCTMKLRERISRAVPIREATGTSSADRTTLGDWTANVVIVCRQHLVLAVNDETLLPVVWPIAPVENVLPRFAVAARDMPHGPIVIARSR